MTVDYVNAGVVTPNVLSATLNFEANTCISLEL
jgi:hypothetical protein